MTKLRLLSLLVFTSIFCTSVTAQVNYYSGFDTPEEREGWVEYKTAATTFSHWEYSTVDPYSPENCVGHDYSPSTGITLTDNWYVSPVFYVTAGGTLDSLRYAFSGFSVPTSEDTIGVYLLRNNQDPELASSKELLFDFRGDDYITDGVYRQLTDIDLPASTQPCYLALRYKNSDCSSYWLSVRFDNIAITHSPTASIDLPEPDRPNFFIYPNPATNLMNIISASKIKSFEVFNVLGTSVHSSDGLSHSQLSQINVSNYAAGVYVIKVATADETYTRKFIVQ